MIVFDTNVVWRIVSGMGHIGREARRIIDGEESRYCSTTMHWEFSMLADKRRLVFDRTTADWIEHARSLLMFVDVPVSGAIARDAGALLGSIHGDPCDRIMIATARSLNAALVTTDQKILDYATAGHVGAIDARR